jgi:urea transporter
MPGRKERTTMTAAAPQRAAEAWSGLAEGNPVMTVVDTLLRGVGQVMFQNNPLTGLIFLAGIFVNSGKLGGLGLLGLAASTLTAYLLGADRALIRNGLFGFNGILVGIGLAFFLDYNGLLIGYVILGGALSTVAMMGLANLFSVWDMPALTAPFVLTAWLLLFAVLLFANLRPNPLIAPVAPDTRILPETALREAATGAGAIGLTPVNMTNALFRGIGEVMFQDKLATGVIFLFAIFVNSRISALFALLGSALGALTAWTVGASGVANFHGLYGFNPVLCAIALGGIFFVLTWRSAVYALVAALVSALVFAAISTFLAPIGMPALTAPFVLVTWIFLLAKAGFKALVPVGLADVSTAEATLEGYRTGGRGPEPPSPDQPRRPASDTPKAVP